MRRTKIFMLCMLSLISCTDKNPVNSNDGAGTAVIQCILEQAKPALTEELKPTTKADISFYDAQNTLLIKQALTVSGNRITGSVKIKEGSGYRTELFCYDKDNTVTHSGTASNITIVAGQQTTVTILLKPAKPEAPVAAGSTSNVTPGAAYSLSWDEVSRVKSYTIEEATDSSFSNATSQTIIGSSASFTKNTAQTYYYRVKANNSTGSSGWSNTVTIAVASIQHTLTIAVNNAAWGSTIPGVGDHLYDEGATIDIEAIPAQGYQFAGWTGGVTDNTAKQTTVKLIGDKTVTANFEPAQYTLTMAVNQDGWGAVNPTAGGHKYNNGETVTITATPASGYLFVNWTGSVADASSAATTVTVSGNMTVTANFEKIPTLQSDITFVTIPTGTFRMGDIQGGGDSDELPVHTVTVSSFEMSIYEVTQGQYESITGSNPSSGYGVGADYPVYSVSWYDMVKFCNKLSDAEGLERCYNESTWSCDFSKSGFRLPTEAEWEYACRAGTETMFYTGNNLSSDGKTSTDLDRAGWYLYNWGETNNKTHVVGAKEPNAFGLYDMHGNVWEWCNDWYGRSYQSGSVTDPTGAQTGSYRVWRGGSWKYGAYYCTSAFRGGLFPDYSSDQVGFRVVRR